ncbi:hypothetical protein EVAR_62316_1 [Eumeta japonica]|uniref:Uncharacterized protein n=1 Tax=Eumeta variegata TaxID=151549 RepID=A0A4C1ZFV3_EUMVA|nr:hypothetical protein EVAR_62316_1 [Eumeta japonica]
MRPEAGIEIENETGVRIEYGIGIRSKSMIAIEIKDEDRFIQKKRKIQPPFRLEESSVWRRVKLVPARLTGSLTRRLCCARAADSHAPPHPAPLPYSALKMEKEN